MSAVEGSADVFVRHDNYDQQDLAAIHAQALNSLLVVQYAGAAIFPDIESSPCTLRADYACSRFGNKLCRYMRVIARNVLVNFWGRHPEAKVPLERWHKLVKPAQWTSTDEVPKAAPKAKVLNRERVRFEVAGGNYRLVAAFDFRRQIAFVKSSAPMRSMTASMH